MQKFTLWSSIVSSIVGGTAGAIYFVLARPFKKLRKGDEKSLKTTCKLVNSCYME